MVIASKFNIPFLLDLPDSGHRVQGEVYRIDQEKLENLDILEDYPKLYKRRLEKVEMDEGGETLQCITYFLVKHKDSMLDPEKFLEDYTSTDERGYRSYVLE